MAIVTGFVEEDADVFGHRVCGGDVVGTVAADVFCGAEELDYDQEGEEGEEEFFDDFHLGDRSSNQDMNRLAELLPWEKMKMHSSPFTNLDS